MDTEAAWQEVQGGLIELVGEFGQDIVVIGGIAVYLHVASAGIALGLPLETTHDGDLFISLAGYSDVRDMYFVENSRQSPIGFQASRVLAGLPRSFGRRGRNGNRWPRWRFADAGRFRS